MIHRNDIGLWYFACHPECGICGPMRARRSQAKADERAHRSCCATATRLAQVAEDIDLASRAAFTPKDAA